MAIVVIVLFILLILLGSLLQARVFRARPQREEGEKPPSPLAGLPRTRRRPSDEPQWTEDQL